MNAASLKDGAQRALAAISQAEKTKREAVAAAEEACRQACRPHNQMLLALRERYAQQAWYIACDGEDVPFSRSGHQLPPSTSEIVEDGVELIWWDNDGPDTHITITWEQLAAAVAGSQQE